MEQFILVVCIVAFNLILLVSFYSTVLCSGTFLLSSDIRSDGNIAIVKKLDRFFLWFSILYHSHILKCVLEKMCVSLCVCVCLCVCLSVCLSVADRRA